MKSNLWAKGSVFTSFMVCCVVLALLSSSLATEYWVTATGMAPKNASDSNPQPTAEINLGLFKGQTVKNNLAGAQQFTLTLVCQKNESLCMYSCGKTAEDRADDIADLLYNNGGSFKPGISCDTKTLSTSRPAASGGGGLLFSVSRSLALLPEQIVSSVADVPQSEPEFMSYGLWLSTIVMLGAAIAFTLVAAMFAILNTATTPVETIFGVIGLYVWNAIAMVFELLALSLWGAQFHQHLQHSVLWRDELTQQWTTDGMANLGYSYWLVFVAMFLHAVNMGVLWFGTHQRKPKTYRSYRRRWVVLFVIVVTQVTNGAAWLSFSPVANYAAHYYGTSIDNINWQMTQFMIVQLLVTPFIMWAVDHWSFRWVVVIGAVLNGVGMAIKGLSTWDLVTPADLRFTITMVGSVLAAIAQPFTLVIPTRYSQAWHPQSERTVSTTLSSLANPIGCMLGISVTPLYVKSSADVPLINTVWAIPAIVAALTAIAGVTMSHPPTPPSPSAAERRAPEPLLRTLRALCASRPLVILSICFGPAIGAMNGVATLLGQMLCTTGYSTGFVGVCGALLFGCGIPGAILLGLIATKTGRAVETAKVSYSLTAVFLIMFCQAARYPDLEWLVGLSIGLVGLVGVGTYPLVIELGVEATYPIDQTYSNSLIFIPGSLVGAALVVLGTVMGRPVSEAARQYEVCSVDGAAGAVEPLDYTNYYMLMTSLLSVSVIAFTLLFDTPYHRTARDQADGNRSETVSVAPADATASLDDRGTEQAPEV
ncbi:uncharacterized protein FJT64_025144 [Amphibalanus amphitrite]|nr:uncharacterized protein FJT64_025144 [Amphibalanus amphitrite]